AMREQPEIQFTVEEFSDDLRVLVGLEENIVPFTHDWHLIIPLLRKAPDEGAVRRLDISRFVAYPAEIEDALLNQAVRAPGKLDQLDHQCRCRVMREATRPTVRQLTRSNNVFPSTSSILPYPWIVTSH